MKYIFTENQVKTIIDNQLNEQSSLNKDCFFMAHDNSKTTFDGGAIRNGYLTFSSEMNTYTCGKIANIININKPSSVDIIKKNGVSSVYLYQNGKPIQVRFESNCSCRKL